MEAVIRAAITEALAKLGVTDADFAVEHPGELSHGDYACNVALVVTKEVEKAPREIAEQLRATLDGQIEYVEKIEVAGPGFLNFYLSRDFFTQELNRATKLGDDWGKNETLAGQRIMVEYTQPNPFKVFHIGHLMSNTIGESLSRLVEVSGAETFRANYQGDVGLHIGKTMWALQELGYDPTDIPKVGEAYAYGNTKYEEDPEAKQAIIALTKAVYAEAPEVMEMYQKGREASLEHFAEIYERLGSKFDELFFESQTWKQGGELVRAHVGDVFEESAGAIVYKGEQDGLHTRVFINSEGVTTYEAKDVGLAYTKKERWPFDLCIYVTAVEQDQYFKVVFKAIEKLDDWFKGRLTNVAHGMMTLPDGKMSSRKGNVITGEGMLNDAQAAALEKIKDNDALADKDTLADQIGVAALKYMILRQSLGKNTVYDIDRALSFEGDSGPYLQYTHARINSVLEKAVAAGVTPSFAHAPETPYEIEKILYRYEEVITEAASEREPHTVVTFLTELAGAFNSFYGQEKIADVDDEFAPYKAAVANAVRQTLKNGLWVLGVKAPEKM